jgi:hypothetical protein
MYPGLQLEQDAGKEFSRRLQKLGPRDSLEPLLKERVARFRAIAHEALGTDQQPFMLLFGESTYSAFIPDLLTEDDIQAFINVWLIRGYIPATMTALKTGGHWTYSLDEEFRAI